MLKTKPACQMLIPNSKCPKWPRNAHTVKEHVAGRLRRRADGGPAPFEFADRPPEGGADGLHVELRAAHHQQQRQHLRVGRERRRPVGVWGWVVFGICN